MRICILAFDGLEAKLVKKMDLKTLLQRRHGTYPVASSDYATPALWASFLTGLSPKEHGIQGFVRRRFIQTERVKKLLKYVRLLNFARKVFLGSKIDKKIFKPRPESVKHSMTIFAHAKLPLPYNVFSYNEEPEQFELRYRFPLTKIVGDRVMSKIALKAWKKLTLRNMKVFLELLSSKRWDLAMTHIYYTDYVGHVAWGTKDFYESYLMADQYAKKVSRVIGDDTLLLIVSDHGMDRGFHTNYGFYSLNRDDIEVNIKDIRDFHSFILKLMNI